MNKEYILSHHDDEQKILGRFKSLEECLAYYERMFFEQDDDINVSLNTCIYTIDENGDKSNLFNPYYLVKNQMKSTYKQAKLILQKLNDIEKKISKIDLHLNSTSSLDQESFISKDSI